MQYFLLCLFSLNVFANQSCLILLDHKDFENIERTSSFYLISKLQAAIGEKNVPILVHVSLWNSFLERRTSFAQQAKQNSTREHVILSLYEEINSKIAQSPQDKQLIVQRINDEFYSSGLCVTDVEYQLLLNYLTPFDPSDWSIYKNGGFYLFIPGKHNTLGFKIEDLEEVTHPEDIALNYFDAQEPQSLVRVLSEIFCTNTDAVIPRPATNLEFGGHHSGPSLDDPSSAIMMEYGSPQDRPNLDHSEPPKSQASGRSGYIKPELKLNVI